MFLSESPTKERKLTAGPGRDDASANRKLTPLLHIGQRQSSHHHKQIHNYHMQKIIKTIKLGELFFDSDSGNELRSERRLARKKSY
jgi:hypothetical protein